MDTRPEDTDGYAPEGGLRMSAYEALSLVILAIQAAVALFGIMRKKK